MGKFIHSKTDKTINDLKAINQLYKSGQRLNAKSAFYKILPNAVSEHEFTLFGKLAAKIGLFNEAEKLFESAHESNPENFISLEALSELYLNRGKVGEAVKVLHQLLSSNPYNVNARKKLDLVIKILRPCGEEYQELIEKNSLDKSICYPNVMFNHLIDDIVKNKLRTYVPVRHRIAVITFNLRLGGIEKKVVNLVRQLHKLENDIESVTLLCKSLTHRKEDALLLPLCEKYGLKVKEYAPLNTSSNTFKHDLIKPYSGYLKPMGNIGIQIAQLVVELLDYQPEAVHCYGYQAAEFGIAAAIAGVPNIFLHSGNLRPETMSQDDNWQDHSRVVQSMYQSLASLPNIKIVNNCKKAAQDYADWINLPEHKIHVVYNGVDFSSFKSIEQIKSGNQRESLGIPAGSKIIGSALRFVEQKNPTLWIESARLVATHRPDTYFILLGEGPLYNQMIQQINQCGLSERFFLPGTVMDMHTWYGLFDVVLLTSTMEGTSNVAIEAQWYGIPVISTEVGGMSETLLDSQSGWLIDTADPEKIAEKALWVLDHQQWCQDAAQIGRDFVQQQFDMEKMIKRILSLS